MSSRRWVKTGLASELRNKCNKFNVFNPGLTFVHRRWITREDREGCATWVITIDHTDRHRRSDPSEDCHLRPASHRAHCQASGCGYFWKALSKSHLVAHSARAFDLQRQALPHSSESVRDDSTTFVACEKFGVNSTLDTTSKHFTIHKYYSKDEKVLSELSGHDETATRNIKLFTC